jgi:hypothetical protein
MLQNYLINLPKFPNPSDFKSNEELMLSYTKAYGMAEAVRLINQFMNQQEEIIANLITRNETNKQSE